ncbi:MAG: tRNA pseudouridine(55) synthase TruB [Bacteroidia bacterium]
MNEALSPFHEGKLLLLDKPLGWTSFDLVNKVRIIVERQYKLKRRSLKVGHAGTLDPLATGLMLVCTGKMTKQIESFQGLPKAYSGTFTLGGSTLSFDLEKEVSETHPIEHITKEMILKVASGFIGTHDQEPPVFSAKKIDGARAYQKARRGEDVKMRKAPIEISDFQITRVEMPEVDFIVACTKGTYIRSLARDFGIALQSGAYLSSLRRISIGEHDIKDAMSIESFEESLKDN